MKKIKIFSGSTIDFYKTVRDSKQNPALKSSLNAIHPTIEKIYTTYDHAFIARQLHTLSRNGSLTDKQREYLLALYSYRAAPLKRLRKDLTTNEYGQADTTCPFCTINSANTFDHILPKIEFEELAVHPLNLIPCCSQCNSYKSDVWLKRNSLKYLNLYQDDLPSEQYLFVRLTIKDGGVHAKFYVQNNGSIPADLFERISDTYAKLKLCRRFRERCSEEIYEVRNSIQYGLSISMSTEQIKNGIRFDAGRMKYKYGSNYWKAILKEACCNDGAIFSFLSTMQ